MTTATITNHGCQTGDAIFITVAETRWYVKFWYFCTLRKCPLRKKRYKIMAVTDSTTLEIKC